VYSSVFPQYITEAFKERACSKKKLKKERYEKASRRSLRPRVAGCQKKKQKSVPSPEEKEEKKKDRNGEALRRRRQERRLYDQMVVKTCLLKHIYDPYREKLRDAIKERVASYSKSIVKASSGLVHLAREMYRDVAHMETVEIPDEFFDKTCIRHLMLGSEEARRENMLLHALHENIAEFRFEGTPFRGDPDIYTYGAMKYLTNLKNLLTMNLDRFVVRAVFLCSTRASLATGYGQFQWHHERS